MPHAVLPSSLPARSRSARTQGIAYAIGSAALFSCNTNLARLAFASGANATTLNAVRFVVGVLLLLSLAAFGPARTPLRLGQRLAAGGLGVLFFLTSYGYMGAIQYIPVSIAALLLYSYPILVALIARVSEGEPLGLARIAALCLGFVGIALALGVAPDAWPDWRGVALSALASVSMSVLVIASSRLLRAADHAEVNRHLMAVAAALFLILFAASGPAHWPAAAGGWLAFAGATITFAIAQAALIVAIGRAGAVLSSMLMNLEPILTIAIAVLALGESLAGSQLVGAALVLAAIFLIGRGGRVPAPVAEP